MSFLWKCIYVLLSIFFISSFLRMVFDYRRNLSFYTTIKQNVENAQEKNKKLNSAYALAGDVYEFEKKVRNKLNMHKPGEIVVMIPDPSLTPKHISPTLAPPYVLWIDVLFSH